MSQISYIRQQIMEHAKAGVRDPYSGWTDVTVALERDIYKALRHERGKPTLTITDQTKQSLTELLEKRPNVILTIKKRRVSLEKFLDALQKSAHEIVENGSIDEVLKACDDIRTGYIGLFTAVGPTHCDKCDSDDGLYIQFTDMQDYGRYCREHLWELLQHRSRASLAEEPVIIFEGFQYQICEKMLSCYEGDKYNICFNSAEELQAFVAEHPPATVDELIEFRRKDAMKYR